jgi:hypothetical protein
MRVQGRAQPWFGSDPVERFRAQDAQNGAEPSVKSPTCMTAVALKYAGFMVKSWLKVFFGLALAAAVAWTAYDGRAKHLLAAVLVFLCVAVFWLRASARSRLRTELLQDPAVSTLVFPPESKLHQPPR